MTFSQRVAHGNRAGQGIGQRVRPQTEGFFRLLELGARLLELSPVQMDEREGERGGRA